MTPSRKSSTLITDEMVDRAAIRFWRENAHDKSLTLHEQSRRAMRLALEEVVDEVIERYRYKAGVLRIQRQATMSAPQCGPAPEGADEHARRFHEWPPEDLESMLRAAVKHYESDLRELADDDA